MTTGRIASNMTTVVILKEANWTAALASCSARTAATMQPNPMGQAKKLAENNAKLSDYKKLNKKISYYFHNYDFAREIQLLLNTYSEDELRVRNIKNSVVNSLKHKKLIDEIYEFYKSTW